MRCSDGHQVCPRYSKARLSMKSYDLEIEVCLRLAEREAFRLLGGLSELRTLLGFEGYPEEEREKIRAYECQVRGILEGLHAVRGTKGK